MTYRGHWASEDEFGFNDTTRKRERENLNIKYPENLSIKSRSLFLRSQVAAFSSMSCEKLKKEVLLSRKDWLQPG